MGRKKIKIQKIEDERKRRLTFHKRRHGGIKKLMELSILSGGTDIYCIIKDEDGKIMEYKNRTDFDPFDKNVNWSTNVEKTFVNNDYEDFKEEKITIKRKKKKKKKKKKQESSEESEESSEEDEDDNIVVEEEEKEEADKMLNNTDNLGWDLSHFMENNPNEKNNDITKFPMILPIKT